MKCKKKKVKYTENEILIIKESYPRFGSKYCATLLNRNASSITEKARRLGIKYNKEEIHDSLRPVNFEQFLNINTKEVAYFLGYFWADGNVKNYTINKIIYWRICLEIVGLDGADIKETMNKIGKWSIVKRKRGHWKETWSFVTNNKPLCLFLLENDFGSKSQDEPTKILNLIPENLRIYFWRGYFDGDGSCGTKGKYAYLEFASTYQYKYSEIKKLYDSLGIIKYNSYDYVSKKGHKSSTIKIYGKSILPMLTFLSKSEIGLSRKTDKMNEIINKYNKKTNL